MDAAARQAAAAIAGLLAAGLTDLARLDFAGPNHTGIVAGRKA